MKSCNAILFACAGMVFAGPIAPRQDDTDGQGSVCNKFGLDLDQCIRATTACISETCPSDPTKQVGFEDIEACVGAKSKAANNEDTAAKKPTDQEKKPTGLEKKPTGSKKNPTGVDKTTKNKGATSN